MTIIQMGIYTSRAGFGKEICWHSRFVANIICLTSFVSIASSKNTPRACNPGSWFLFDILFYGNNLFEPIVIEAAFGSHASTDDTHGYSLLQKTVLASLLISLLALPGYFVTVLLIGRRTCVCGSARSSSSRLGSASCFPCEQTPGELVSCWYWNDFNFFSIVLHYWSSISLHSNARLFRHVHTVQYHRTIVGCAVQQAMALTPPVCWYILR
jgi:hypothetical protein